MTTQYETTAVDRDDKGVVRSAIEISTMRKVTLRLLPFICLIYFINYLDRVNVGFAALGMNKALGFSASTYGTGAGMFFLAYFLCEVPANLIGQRVGMRRWMCRIMITWGIISMGMMAVVGPTSFYVMRFLLGVGEAGFAPGILLYVTYWFPEQYRGRILGTIFALGPISTVIGSPISGVILDTMDGVLGLGGWQWLFIMEGAPAVIAGFAALVIMTDRPGQARWLEPAERDWLERRMASEANRREQGETFKFLQAVISPRILLLTASYFLVVVGLLGITFFLPQIVKGFGNLSNTEVGFITMLPSICAAVVMILWSRHSDRTGERIWHVTLPILVAGFAMIAASSLLESPVLAMIAICVGFAAVWTMIPPFWTLPMAFLSGTAAAGGMAFINSLAVLGGYFGPSIIGFLKDATGSFSAGLIAIGVLQFVAAALAFFASRSLVGRRAA